VGLAGGNIWNYFGWTEKDHEISQEFELLSANIYVEVFQVTISFRRMTLKRMLQKFGVRNINQNKMCFVLVMPCVIGFFLTFSI
jgi:hypothetical protein